MRVPVGSLFLYTVMVNDYRLVFSIGVLGNQVLNAFMAAPWGWWNKRRDELDDRVCRWIECHQCFRDGDDFLRGGHQAPTQANPTVFDCTLLQRLHFGGFYFAEQTVIDGAIFHFVVFYYSPNCVVKKQRRGGEPRRCRI